MIVPARARRASAALVSVALAGAAVAHAQEGPSVGGSVPSVLGLSLSEPSGFSRSAAGHAESVYTSIVRVEVTATDAPTRLSIADGEVAAGARHGRLVRGRSILSPPLRAAANHGAYNSLDATVDPVLEQWNEPVAHATATIRLRQAVRGAPPTLRDYHKLLLVTITAAGP